MRKRFCAAVVCFFGTFAWGQSLLTQPIRPMALHASSNAGEWVRETVHLIEPSRLSYEARELHLHVCSLLDLESHSSVNSDDEHPLRLQVKQGVPTAREPKWPSVPPTAVPKVGVREVRPGALQEQRSEVQSGAQSRVGARH